MLGGNVVDKLHDDNRFSDARAAEQTDFSAFGIRADQVNDFDARFRISVEEESSAYAGGVR